MAVSAPRHRFHYALVVVAATSLATMGAVGLGRFSYPIILPVMQPGMGLTSTQSGLLASANLLGFMVASGVSGAAVMRWGARRTIVGGLALTAVGLLLTGLAPSLEVALAAQLLDGLGTGAAAIPSMGMAGIWVSPAYRGRASGAIVAGAGPGILLSGLLLPWLMGGSDWRAAWLCLAGLVILVGVACWVLLRNRPEELGLAPLGMAQAPPPTPARGGAWALLVRSPVFWQLGVVFALFGLAYTAYATFFPAYLVREAGFSQAAAGGLWGMTGILAMVGALLWGSIADTIGRRQALAAVFAVFCVAFLASALAPGPLGYYVAPALFGLTFWAPPTIIGAASGDYFGDRLVYASFGLLALLSGVGQTLGPGLAGLIADLTGSFASAFLLAGVASLAALGLALRLPPSGRSPR